MSALPDLDALARSQGIVGRRTELRMVGACLRAGRNVLLEGPVGVGKTALARSVAAGLDRGFVRVDGDGRYTAADGSAPLGQSFDPNDVCRTERRLRAELDQTVHADVKRKRWTRPLDVRLSDAAADDGLLGGDENAGFSRSHAPRLWGRVDAVFAAAAYVHELEALKAEDKNTIARVHACIRGSIKDYIHGAIDSSENSSKAGAGAGAASTTRHGSGRREPLPEHAEWRPVLIANVRGRGEPREAKEPVSLGWEDVSADGTKKKPSPSVPRCA